MAKAIIHFQVLLFNIKQYIQTISHMSKQIIVWMIIVFILIVVCKRNRKGKPTPIKQAPIINTYSLSIYCFVFLIII